MPRALISSKRSTRRPLNRSITSTLRVQYSWCGTGAWIALWPSSRMMSLNWSRFAASMRKSSSSLSVFVKSSTTPTGFARSASFLKRASSRASVRISFMSAMQRGMMPGRWTLITTSVPSRSFAVWTCAIEADASCLGSMSIRCAAFSAPSSSSSVRCTSENGNGFTRSRTFWNSLTYGSGNMPADDAMIWPNLMNVGPMSSHHMRISMGRVSLTYASLATNSLRRPIASATHSHQYLFV